MIKKLTSELLYVQMTMGYLNKNLTDTQVANSLEILNKVSTYINEFDTTFNIMLATDLTKAKSALKAYKAIITSHTRTPIDIESILNEEKLLRGRQVELTQELPEYADELNKQINKLIKPYKYVRHFINDYNSASTISVDVRFVEGEDVEVPIVQLNKIDAKRFLKAARKVAIDLVKDNEAYIKVESITTELNVIEAKLKDLTDYRNKSIQVKQAYNTLTEVEDIQNFRRSIDTKAGYCSVIQDTHVDVNVLNYGMFTESEVKYLDANEKQVNKVRNCVDVFNKYRHAREVEVRAMSSANWKLYKELGEEAYKVLCDEKINTINLEHKLRVQELCSRFTPNMIEATHKYALAQVKYKEIHHLLSYVQYITCTLIDLMNTIRREEGLQ